MKKALAIFLLAVTFYNTGGYMVAFQYFIYKANKFKEEQISKERYKPSDLVEIKIPVKLPGIDAWLGYENVSGSVELSQNSYNYVRMKLTADTIYVMCVPNYKTTRLIKDNLICARDVSDAPLNAKKQTTPAKGISLIKYTAIIAAQTTAPQQFIVRPLSEHGDSKTVTGISDNPVKPPRSILS